MKKEIFFKINDLDFTKEVNCSCDIIIPRIGEKIDITDLFEDINEKKEFINYKNHNNKPFFVVDIMHYFNKETQFIEIYIKSEIEDLDNDFYNKIMNK